MIAKSDSFQIASLPASPPDALLARPFGVPEPPEALLAAKFVLDFVLALMLFVLTLPLMLLAMVLVKLTSPGPAIYSQVRIGRNGRPFRIFKIRTMGHNCERSSGVQWSQQGDTRITVVGKWLRKTHVDELPQLWNVLRGDMSLIGPRPERPEFIPWLEREIDHYRSRLLVRPGVTGLAQVQLPPDSEIEGVRVKLAYDLDYVRSVGLFLDLRIYLATLGKILGLRFGTLRWLFNFAPQEDVLERYRSLGKEERREPATPRHAVPSSTPTLAVEQAVTGNPTA